MSDIFILCEWICESLVHLQLTCVCALCPSDNFQDQMKRELSYREEMVQQLHIVRGEKNKAEGEKTAALPSVPGFTAWLMSVLRDLTALYNDMSNVIITWITCNNNYGTNSKRVYFQSDLLGLTCTTTFDGLISFFIEAHDALHHFSCKMLTPRHCSGSCSFKSPLLPPWTRIT